jgi:hypothetical protein
VIVAGVVRFVCEILRYYSGLKGLSKYRADLCRIIKVCPSLVPYASLCPSVLENLGQADYLTSLLEVVLTVQKIIRILRKWRGEIAAIPILLLLLWGPGEQKPLWAFRLNVALNR